MEKKINDLGVMIDCSRDAVYTVATVKRYIDLLAKMGYTTLQIYTEDTYPVDEPYFGYLRGRYSKEELKELDAYAFERGIELVPCIQTLAHLSGLLRWKPELTDYADILLAGEEKTYALIEKMFLACAECFRSRRINIGMDEAHMVGLGKYLDKNGYQNRTEILIAHLKRVLKLAKKYSFTPMMWSDMFFRLANNGKYEGSDGGNIPQEVLDITPKEVSLVYWEYSSDDLQTCESMMSAHKKFGNHIVFAGGATSWLGFVPKNRHSIRVTKNAVQACLNSGIDEFLLTCWKDDGAECSLFASLPTLYATAQMAKGIFEEEEWAKGFARDLGLNWQAFLSLDEPDYFPQDGLWVNPCKYMLYNDVFLGMFDNTVDEKNVSHFERAEQEITAYAQSAGEYEYLFQTLASLCTVMKTKYALGVQTRKAYKEKDSAALKELVAKYETLANALKILYINFKAQWLKESKFYGFEKHDLRLGGLIQRVNSCKERLESYLSGAITRIEELEEEILPFRPTQPSGKTMCANGWQYIAMIKPNS